jgi:hypothetical protein
MRHPYVIGDIHGCYRELLALEQKVLEHHGSEEVLFISVGDLIDRGPCSREVIEHYRVGERQGTHRAILGNHEAEFLKTVQAYRPDLVMDCWPFYLKTLKEEWVLIQSLESWDNYRDRMKQNWLFQGGKETLGSYQLWPDSPEGWGFPEGHLAYLVGLPLFYEDGEILVSHALMSKDDLGFFHTQDQAPEKKLDAQKAAHRTIWNRKIPEEPCHPQKIHISGHTPDPKVRIHHGGQTVQVDTACVYGGSLLAYAPPKTYLSVPSGISWQTQPQLPLYLSE